MNARPTILSSILGILVVMLTGPMLLLGTVNDDNCPDPAAPTVQRECFELLTDGDFHKRVAAAAIAGIADPWQELAGGLLTMFGIPAFLSVVKRDGKDEIKEEG